MTIQEFQAKIQDVNKIDFALPNGNFIPEHFHITEMGLKVKQFIDCGNTVREDRKLTFQIWIAKDYDHRLTAGKLNGIIKAAAPFIANENLEIEVEYQTDLSLSLFGLDYKNGVFQLVAKKTDCLAKDSCGIIEEVETTSCCSTNSNCC